MSGDLKALITISDPNSPASEAYRTLRTNLTFASIEKPLRTLMFTSPGPDEGKSSVLANLAVSIAQTERQVLVVDCDLRCPCLHEIFGLPNDAGLTTLLANPDALAKPPFRETRVPGLRVLTSGPLPPFAADLVASRRMEELIRWLGQQADIVLFDSPPINAVTDAAILATQVDGVLLAVRERRTQREAVVEARNRLMRVKANLLGAVLNGVSPDRSHVAYYGQRTRAAAKAKAGAGAEASAGATSS